MAENLVRKYLEEIKLISSDHLLDSILIDDEEWEIYKVSDDTLLYVLFELTGKLGYAFCARITCKRMTNSFESFYHVKSYGNEVREDWECEQSIKDRLMSNAILILKPY